MSEVVAQDRESVHSFRFRQTELRAALDSLLRWYSVPLIYLEKDVDGKHVTTECSECNFEQALERLIDGQQLRWKVIGDQVLLERHRIESADSASTLGGTVTDSLTGEWVAGANVYLYADADHDLETPYRVCSTNQFGFFSLRNIQPGSYMLIIRSVGYRTKNERVKLQPGTAIVHDLSLCQQDVQLEEITVEGQRSALAASEGISRGVYIRATPSDHNHYLLEGARIYNPSHFGGVMSTFNTDALRDVHVLAGGAPPYYGGRIGGVLDVTLRSGLAERVSGTAGVGSLGSNLMIEGPIAERTTFVISGRRGYPDIFFPRYNSSETPSDLNSLELMTKVSHQLAGNHRLFLSGYFGRDTYDRNIADAGGQLLNTLRWGNAAANLRWIGIVSPSLFVHASAIYTYYGFDVEHRLTGFGNTQAFPSNYSIEDAALRAHAEHFYDEHHTVRGGVELIHHRITGTMSEFSTQIAPVALSGRSSWELSVYFQDQWRLTQSVSAELGARATSFITSQGSFSGIDPRFSLLVSLDDDTRLYSSFTSVNQFVHPYRHSGIFLFSPTIFLYPSTEKIHPSTSLQFSLGMEKNFDENKYTLAIESYYRVTQKLHEFAFDTTRVAFDEAILFGEGTNYGAELTFSKRTGDFTGTIRYTLAWARNRFAELNDGKPYASRFDRRHEVYASISFSLNENWNVGALCLLSSNQSPSLLPQVTTFSGSPPRVTYEKSSSFDLNGGRLPGFQRLELRATHRFSWWGLPFQATLRLLNGYGLLDPFAWELRDSPDNRLKWRATFDGPDLFPLHPVVNLNVKF